VKNVVIIQQLTASEPLKCRISSTRLMVHRFSSGSCRMRWSNSAARRAGRGAPGSSRAERLIATCVRRLTRYQLCRPSARVVASAAAPLWNLQPFTEIKHVRTVQPGWPPHPRESGAGWL